MTARAPPAAPDAEAARIAQGLSAADRLELQRLRVAFAREAEIGTEQDTRTVQQHRNEAYTGGFGDGYAEGFGKALRSQKPLHNLAEIIEAELMAWRGATGAIHTIHACALGVSVAVRAALAAPSAAAGEDAP